MAISLSLKVQGELTALTWAAVVDAEKEQVQFLFIFAADSIIYLRDIETGKHYGMLRGHGAVSLLPL